MGHLNREAPLLLLSLLSRHGQGEQQARARKTPGRAQQSPPGHRLVEVAYGPLLNVAGGMRRARCAEMVAGQLKAPFEIRDLRSALAAGSSTTRIQSRVRPDTVDLAFDQAPRRAPLNVEYVELDARRPRVDDEGRVHGNQAFGKAATPRRASA